MPGMDFGGEGHQYRDDADLAESLLGFRPEGSPSMSRRDHLQWAKDRAKEYLDAGDPMTAWTSFVSDLRKHPNLLDHAGLELGMMLVMGGHNQSVEDMRYHIEGFN